MEKEYDLLIHSGMIVTPSGIVHGDLAIKDNIISMIGNKLGAAKEKIAANGKFVMPGGVDVHAHIEQISGMGQMNADTFESATRSAAMGGTTSVISFAAQAVGQTLSKTVAN